MKKKIFLILGARPQFIKAAPLFHSLKQYDNIEMKIIHTGQHFDKNMSDIFFKEMNIPNPDYELNIHSLPHGAMTGRMLEQIENILLREKPQWVMVFGDTNSTLAGALAARKLDIPIAHVEAGLRSHNMLMPEETNRILTDRISSILFCPCEQAMYNLKQEGYEFLNIDVINSGDIMFDAVQLYDKIADEYAARTNKLTSNKYIVATIHRQENTSDQNRFLSIIKALNEISNEIDIIAPLHPRTLKLIDHTRILPKFKIIKPVGYLDMLNLVKNSELVITDSGGLQKESYYLKKQSLVLREETEWKELPQKGFSHLTGWNYRKIIKTYNKIIHHPVEIKPGLYGAGKTSEIILSRFL